LFIPGRLWRCVPGLVLALATGPVGAEDFEAGKSPSAIFAADCSGCHRSPRGLAKTMNSRSALSAFLREHYTTGSGPASELSSYLLGQSSGEDRRSPKPAALGEGAPRSADKPGRRRAQEAVIPPQTVPPSPLERAGKKRRRGEAPAQISTDQGRHAPEAQAPAGKGRPGSPVPERAETTAGTGGGQPAAEPHSSEPRPLTETVEPKGQDQAARRVEPHDNGPPTGASESRRESGPGAVESKRDGSGAAEIAREAVRPGAVEPRREAPAEPAAEIVAKPQPSSSTAPSSGAADPPAGSDSQAGPPPGRGDQSAFSAPSP
jgi:hypothetical protein